MIITSCFATGTELGLSTDLDIFYSLPSLVFYLFYLALQRLPVFLAGFSIFAKISENMRQTNLTQSILLIPLDYLMLMVTALMVYYLRFETLAEWRIIVAELPLKNYLIMSAIFNLVWLFFFALAGLYSFSLKTEFLKIFFACSAGIMFIILVIFFRRELFASRFVILAAWPLSIFFIYFGRKIFRFFWRIFFQKKQAIKIFCLGDGEMAENLVKKINQQINPNYQIVGWFKETSLFNEQFLIEEKIKIDEILLLNPNLDREEKWRLLSLADEFHLPFKYLADPFDALVTHLGVEDLLGAPVIVIKRTALQGWGWVVKRIFDCFGAFFGLILLSPLFLIIALFIKLDSAGPVIVRLKRVGERGKIFNLYKFRSMVKNAELLKKDLLKYSEREGPLFKMKNDPRITKFGRFLRKTSIDELPQLFNILKGEMSLVGPRPHEPEEVSQYEKYQKRLLTIKPGLTGLAQISGRSDLSFKEEAKLDLFYVENWSFLKDLEIILKTLPVVLFKKPGC